MLKLLFKILQSFPAFQKLLSGYFEAERAELQRRVSEWQETTSEFIKDALRHQTDAENWKHKADLLATEIQLAEATIRERNTEIERLQNETQQRLKAVDAMDSESVFNATLDGATAQVRQSNLEHEQAERRQRGY